MQRILLFTENKYVRNHKHQLACTRKLFEEADSLFDGFISTPRLAIDNANEAFENAGSRITTLHAKYKLASDTDIKSLTAEERANAISSLDEAIATYNSSIQTKHDVAERYSADFNFTPENFLSWRKYRNDSRLLAAFDSLALREPHIKLIIRTIQIPEDVSFMVEEDAHNLERVTEVHRIWQLHVAKYVGEPDTISYYDCQDCLYLTEAEYLANLS